MAQEDPMLKIRNTYLNLVMRAQRAEFRPVPTSGPLLEDKALFASLTWCKRVFRVPVHRPGDTAEHSYHVANAGLPIDLLLHRLTVDSVPVRVYEASSFFTVLVPLANLPGGDPGEKAAQAANLLLALKAPVAFKPIAGEPDQKAYSTNAGQSVPGFGEWRRRIDAVALDGDLALVVYKITYDDMMTIVSDPADWFEDLRQAK